jgi:radical SAM protein with 4Fe4S-binding SPASM domain
MWHLNNECNLQCRHCYIKNQSRIPVDRLDFQLKAIDRIIELCEYYSLIRVGLLGGEPLLDPNIFTIIKHLNDVGVRRVDIGTNATLIDFKCAKQIASLNVKMVQISLEGHNSEVNDQVRGTGSFKKSIHGLRLLRNCGIDVGIMTTVSKFNLQYIENIVNMAEREGAKLIAFNRMLPIGKGKGGMLIPLESHEMKEMMRLIHSLNDSRSIEVTSDDPLLYVPVDGRILSSSELGGCGAGIGNLAICHNGDVFPCRRLPIVVGNISDSSLLDIINSEKMDCFYDRKSFLKGYCAECDFRQICGGCRAAAYAYTGDHHGHDPQCWRISTVYKGGD